MGQRLGAVAEIVQILPIEGVGVDAGNCQLLKEFGKAGGQQLRAGDFAALKLPPERLVDLLVEVIGGLGEGKSVVGKGALQGLTLGGGKVHQRLVGVEQKNVVSHQNPS